MKIHSWQRGWAHAWNGGDSGLADGKRMVASDCLSPTLLNVFINDSNRDMLAADSRLLGREGQKIHREYK